MRCSTILTKLVLVLPARAWSPEFLALRSTTHIKQDCPGLAGALCAFNVCFVCWWSDKTTFDRKIMMEVGNSQRVSAVAPEVDCDSNGQSHMDVSCDSNDQSHMDVSIQTRTSRKDERNMSPDDRKLARRLRKEAAKEQKKGESLRVHAH